MPREVELPESNKREEKRAALVSAAVRVLISDGLGACSARRVAREAGVSKSIFHYYFKDMDELIHLAIRAGTEHFFDSVRSAGEGDSLASFWTAIESYIVPFQAQIILWLDYWLYCVRSGSLEPIRDIQSLLAQLFEDLLEPLDVGNVEERAHSLASFAFGTVMQQSIEPIPIARLRSEISLVSGAPLPQR
ncbi:MAG: TetR family transcriptional regulator [Actinomycetia bacterium]|nr:TetR family transcriptional regulator [Actinomycetes bacterium]MCP5035122.1 TetR family transcriptional regulator [Actinomycetes bacterium]